MDVVIELRRAATINEVYEAWYDVRPGVKAPLLDGLTGEACLFTREEALNAQARPDSSLARFCSVMTDDRKWLHVKRSVGQ